jgi:hypothetical protein
MCYFLTIGIPGSIGPETVKVFPADMAVWQCENKNIMAHLPPECHGYVVTTGICSCDIYHWANGDLQEEIEKLQEKYRKKGWSKSKIDRAVEGATGTRKTKSSGLRADAREAIFVHFYSGDQTTEDVTICPGPTVTAEDFGSLEYLLAPDTLVKVVSKGELTGAKTMIGR